MSILPLKRPLKQEDTIIAIICVLIAVYLAWSILIMVQHCHDDLYITTFMLAIPSLIVAIVTISYVLLTRELVENNQSLFNAQTNPNIIAYLKIEKEESEGITQKHFHKIRYLVIANVGLGIAKNVKFKITPSDLKINDRILDEHSLIKKGIPVIGPKEEMKIKLDISDLNSIPITLQFQITIEYQNYLDQKIGPYPFDVDSTIFIDS